MTKPRKRKKTPVKPEAPKARASQPRLSDVAEVVLGGSPFVGYVAIGVDNRGELHSACDSRSPEFAIGTLMAHFESSDLAFEAQCIYPSTVRVFVVGSPLWDKAKFEPVRINADFALAT